MKSEGKRKTGCEGAIERIRVAAGKSAAITREIGDIAFQANLLALEAAAQAARAGDAGKDIAAAADRVRLIALRAQDAAWRTGVLIDECEELSRNVETAALGVQERLSLVITSVDDFSEHVRELLDGVRTQLHGIECAREVVSKPEPAKADGRVLGTEGTTHALVMDVLERKRRHARSV